MFLAMIALITIASCSKKSDDISELKTVTRPTVSFPAGNFFSINVGGTLPTISTTAYDSALNEAYPAQVTGLDAIDNTTPGLYVVTATATNRYGFTGSSSVYVAVTDIPDAADLSGDYFRAATGTTTTVTKVSRGLYRSENFGGSPSIDLTVYFAQITDSTLSIPEQPTEDGTSSGEDATVTYPYTDSTILTYRVISPSFGTGSRTFVKQ